MIKLLFLRLMGTSRKREDMSLLRSLIFELVRLLQKLRLWYKKGEMPRIIEIGRFLGMTTLKRLEYCKHKGCFPHHKSSQNRFFPHHPPQSGCVWKNLGKTCAMAFQGLWCDHLIVMLTSQSLGFVPQMLKMTSCQGVETSIGYLQSHFPTRAHFFREIFLK